MKYLSFDLEATGLDQDCLIIEFAAVPIDADKKLIDEKNSFHTYVQCPSFESIEASLNPWVRENNKELIIKAHSEGVPLQQFKESLEKYLESPKVKEFFNNERIVLFGKSVNAIDLPFMTRDLGWEWMRKHFSHRVLDFSSFCYGMIDAKKLEPGMESGSKLMDHLNMGEVAHTALADAVNTAKMYFEVLDLS